MQPGGRKVLFLLVYYRNTTASQISLLIFLWIQFKDTNTTASIFGWIEVIKCGCLANFNYKAIFSFYAVEFPENGKGSITVLITRKNQGRYCPPQPYSPDWIPCTNNIIPGTYNMFLWAWYKTMLEIGHSFPSFPPCRAVREGRWCSCCGRGPHRQGWNYWGKHIWSSRCWPQLLEYQMQILLLAL